MTFTMDQIRGAIYGTAIGDALARDAEFMNLRDIYRKYGRTGYVNLPDPALFTDDTQMTIRVAWALREGSALNGTLSPRNLRTALIDQFDAWALNDDRRAPGNSCMTSVRRHRAVRKWKGSWTQAPVISLGCGANMRVAPVAFLASDDMVGDVAQLQAAVTHAHPTALVAAELTALAIRWSTVMSPVDVLDELIAHASSAASYRDGGYREAWLGGLRNRWTRYHRTNYTMAQGWRDNLLLLRRVRDNRATEISDPCVTFGGAWVADEALACSLYLATRYAGDPVAAVSMAVRTSGDSDSIGAITGAIVGARWGVHAWPSRWLDRIERRDDLESTAKIVSWLTV